MSPDAGSPAAEAIIDALLEAVALKDVARAGWVRRGVPDAESVAAHSWGVAWLVVVLCPADLDRERALTYAVLHDLAEVRVGDLTPHDGVSAEDKAQREARALDDLAAALPSHVRHRWHAYEAKDDPEARFVRQLDRLDMALQAAAYGASGHLGTPGEFLRSADPVITHPALRPLFEALCDRVGMARP